MMYVEYFGDSARAWILLLTPWSEGSSTETPSPSIEWLLQNCCQCAAALSPVVQTSSSSSINESQISYNSSSKRSVSSKYHKASFIDNLGSNHSSCKSQHLAFSLFSPPLHLFHPLLALWDLSTVLHHPVRPTRLRSKRATMVIKGPVFITSPTKTVHSILLLMAQPLGR